MEQDAIGRPLVFFKAVGTAKFGKEDLTMVGLPPPRPEVIEEL